MPNEGNEKGNSPDCQSKMADGGGLASSKGLEQFVLLAKSAKGAAVVELINQALAAPGVFVFGELLEMSSVKELAGGPDKQYLALLEVFAYGTVADYSAVKETLPHLSSVQLAKLRLLTIAELASRHKTIPYSTLMESLDLSSTRELEDLIIEAFYANVIHGQLDQVNKQLIVQGFIGRDIKDAQVPSMIEKLEAWCSNCAGVLGGLEAEMQAADARKMERTEANQKVENEISLLRSALRKVNQDDQKMPDDMLMDTGGGKRGLRGSGKLFPLRA